MQGSCCIVSFSALAISAARWSGLRAGCGAAVIAGWLKPSRFATRRQNGLGEQRRRVGVVTVGHRREAVDARPGRGEKKKKKKLM